MGREAVNLFSRGGICPPPRATDTATRSVGEKEQALVVGRLNNAIHYIKLYPVDNAIHFAITYPPDSDLSAYREFKLLLQRHLHFCITCECSVEFNSKLELIAIEVSS